jgi:hypothetical protein
MKEDQEQGMGKHETPPVDVGLSMHSPSHHLTQPRPHVGENSRHRARQCQADCQIRKLDFEDQAV